MRKIIHSRKLVDYLHVQADSPWYNYYLIISDRLESEQTFLVKPLWSLISLSQTVLHMSSCLFHYFRPSRKRADLSGRATVVVDLTESDCEDHHTVTSSTHANSNLNNVETNPTSEDPVTEISSSSDVVLPEEADMAWSRSSASSNMMLPPEPEIAWNRAQVPETVEEPHRSHSFTAANSRRCGSTSHLNDPVSCSRVS